MAVTRKKKARGGAGEHAPSGAGAAGTIRRLKMELAAARRRIAELEARADEDPLLPVLNRRGFLRELERAIAYSRRYGATASLVYLDLDGFKAINDAHGHAAGDAVLAEFAELLLNNLRRSDVVGRLGGDEFAILLWSADEAAARSKAGGLADLTADAGFSVAGKTLRLAVSFGLAQLAGEDTAEGAIARADAAMYAQKRAKRAGRGEAASQGSDPRPR